MLQTWKLSICLCVAGSVKLAECAISCTNLLLKHMDAKKQQLYVCHFHTSCCFVLNSHTWHFRSSVGSLHIRSSQSISTAISRACRLCIHGQESIVRWQQRNTKQDCWVVWPGVSLQHLRWTETLCIKSDTASCSTTI